MSNDLDNFTSPNGTEIEIRFAGFREAMALKNAIANAVADKDLKLADIDIKNFKDLSFLNAIFSNILAVDSDPKVYKALFECLKRCRYNKQKITEDTFEDEKAIESYYEIVIACIRKNLGPFLKPLIAKLSKLNQKLETSLE